MTALEDRIPDGLFGLRRHVGRPARCTAIVSESWFDAARGYRPGVLAVLIDVNLGLEISQQHGSPSRGVVTSQLEITFFGDEPNMGETLTAEGTVVASIDGGAVVRGVVRGDDERILAVTSATSRFVVQQRVGVHPSEPVEFVAPLDVSLDDVIGASPVIRGDRSSLTVAGVPRLTNFRGTIHGGVLALFAEWVASVSLGAETDWRVHSLQLHYLRPAGEGSQITASARPLRIGRTVGIVEVTFAVGDMLVCVARVTYNRWVEQTSTGTVP